MKTKLLILGAVVTAFAITAFAAAPLLAPRATGNQIKRVNTAEAPAVTITYVNTSSALLSPRVAGNQIKKTAGVSTEVNPAALCRQRMVGSPKAIAECASHPGLPMPCCNLAAK